MIGVSSVVDILKEGREVGRLVSWILGVYMNVRETAAFINTVPYSLDIDCGGRRMRKYTPLDLLNIFNRKPKTQQSQIVKRNFNFNFSTFQNSIAGLPEQIYTFNSLFQFLRPNANTTIDPCLSAAAHASRVRSEDHDMDVPWTWTESEYQGGYFGLRISAK